MLAEDEHVLVAISEIATPVVSLSLTEELEWLREHENEYRGQWVALDGHQLISHGSKAKVVRDEARKLGVPRPLVVRVDDEPDLASAGWR